MTKLSRLSTPGKRADPLKTTALDTLAMPFRSAGSLACPPPMSSCTATFSIRGFRTNTHFNPFASSVSLNSHSSAAYSCIKSVDKQSDKLTVTNIHRHRFTWGNSADTSQHVA